jgi:hypothetical protein
VHDDNAAEGQWREASLERQLRVLQWQAMQKVYKSYRHDPRVDIVLALARRGLECKDVDLRTSLPRPARRSLFEVFGRQAHSSHDASNRDEARGPHPTNGFEAKRED